MRALEPRVLLDAAAVETALDHVNDTVHAALADEWLERRSDEIVPPADATGVEYIFLAADIGDTSALLERLPDHARVVTLDGARDGVEQIAAALDGAAGVGAIHIVSHGRAGALALGTAELSADSILHRHADALARIGAALAVDGDLMIYGCDFGDGVEGAHAVERLARATGADVAASTDATGAAALGGDWDLETRFGAIEAAAIDGGDALDGLLAVLAENTAPIDGLDHEDLDAGDLMTQTFIPVPSTFPFAVESIEIAVHPKGTGFTAELTVALYENGILRGTGIIDISDAGNNLQAYDVQITETGGSGDPPILSPGGTYTIALLNSGVRELHVGLTGAASQNGGTYSDTEGDVDNSNSIHFEVDGTVLAPPVFDAPAGPGPFDLAETPSSALPLVVSDPYGDDATLSFGITGGDDAGFFQLQGSITTGDLRLELNQPLDARQPQDANGDGVYEVEITLIDQDGLTTTKTIPVRLTDVDQAPVAPPDASASVTEDVPRALSQADLGIVDPDGDPVVSFTLGASDLRGGRLVHSGGDNVVPGLALTRPQFESLIYEPASDYDGRAGDAWFDYQVETENPDGGRAALPAEARFTLTFTPVNDAPRAQPFTVQPTEDEPFAFTAAMFPFSDVDDTVTQVRIVDLPASGGTLHWGPAQAVQAGVDVPVGDLDQLRFVPDRDFDGTATFTYAVTDASGALSTTETVTIAMIPVDDAPVPTTTSVSTPEDVPIFIAIDDFGHVDIEGDAIDTVGITGIDPAEGSFSTGAYLGRQGFWFTPARDASGTFTYEYFVANALPGDGTGTLTIEVTPVDDLPTAIPSQVRTLQDEPYAFSVADFDVEDVEGDDLWITFGGFALQGGTLTRPDPLTGLDVAVSSGERIALGEIDGLTYSPAPGFEGFASFLFTASDGVDGSDPSRASAAVTMTIEVANPPPVAFAAQDRSGIDGVVVTLDLSGAFLDTDDLTYDAAGLPPGLAIDPVTGIVGGRIASAASDVPARLVTVGATDTAGQRVETVFTWAVANPSPIAQDDAFATQEDTVLSGSLAGNDGDPDNDTVTWALVEGPEDGAVTVEPDGRFTYVPDADVNGVFDFTYSLTDAQGAVATAVAYVTIAPVDDAPEARDASLTAWGNAELALADTLLDFEDVDGEAMTALRVLTLPEGGRLVFGPGAGQAVQPGVALSASSVATLRFVPSAWTPDAAPTAFDYELETEGGSSVTASVAIDIQPPRDGGSANDADVEPDAPVEDAAENDEPEAEEAEGDDQDDMEGDAGFAPTAPPALPKSSQAAATVRPQGAAVSAVPAQAQSAPPLPENVAPSSPRLASPAERAREALPAILTPAPQPAQRIEGYAFTPSDPVQLAEAIASASDDVREYEQVLGTTTAKVTFGLGSFLAVGSVTYLIQGGALAGALLSSMPAWRRYDPIEIVSGRTDEEEVDDEPSAVEQMRAAVEAARARVRPPVQPIEETT